MAKDTVRQFAETVKRPVDQLLTQLQEAGLNITDPEHVMTEDEKMKLLGHLRSSHGKSAAGSKKITLKRRSTSEVKAGGTAGKGRTVAVQVRKKRTYTKGAPSDMNEEQQRIQAEAEEARAALEKRRAEQAEHNAKLEEDAAKKRAEREAVEAQKEAERKAAEAEAQRVEDEAKRQAEEEARQAAELEAAKKAAEQAEKAREAAAAKAQEVSAKPVAKPAAAPKRSDKKRGGKKDDSTLHVAAGKSGRRRPQQKRPVKVEVDNQHTFQKPVEEVVRDIEIGETITVAEIAQQMAVKGAEVIKTLMQMGAMVTINQAIDQDTAQLVIEEMGHNAVIKKDESVEDVVLQQHSDSDDDEENLKPRDPVITVMGHVDHGKTSLLDYIRRAGVAKGEAGGITQHIGAYHVETANGGITFLDTPGHAAFTAMRARGASATDIVILVVAGDDGVMPQTIEAIQHSKAAGVPMIVAVNKMDKEASDIERIKSELASHEVVPEDWGGEYQFIPVSAHSGMGIDELLEAISLQAEILELKANPDIPAAGVVIESSLEKGRGAVATVLVQKGSLKQGDMILCGKEYGRVRAMFNENGEALKEVGPSTPVAILGLSGVPGAGEDALVVANERKAREVAEFRENREREQKLARQQAAKLENMFAKMAQGNHQTLNVLLKADVQGSVEALRDSLTKLSNEEVSINIVTSGVGGINSSDVDLAVASEAMLIGFNVRADNAARKLMQEHGVEPHYYSIIYQAIDTLKEMLSGMMAPEIKENILGLAEVKEVFRGSGFGAIAGCLVVEGTVRKAEPVRVLRNNVVIYEGELDSLRRFKDDVTEVVAGTECGIGVKNYEEVKAGDQIECFERIEIARSL